MHREHRRLEQIFCCKTGVETGGLSLEDRSKGDDLQSQSTCFLGRSELWISKECRLELEAGIKHLREVDLLEMEQGEAPMCSAAELGVRPPRDWIWRSKQRGEDLQSAYLVVPCQDCASVYFQCLLKYNLLLMRSYNSVIEAWSLKHTWHDMKSILKQISLGKC